MNKPKRKIHLIIITTISVLSTYQFVDVFGRFKFLLNDFLNNISESVVIYMIFVLFIAISSYMALVYNWKLLRNINSFSESKLIDQSEIKKRNQFGLLHFSYVACSGLVMGLGIFLLLKPLQENYPIENLPNGLLPYFVAIIIVTLGLVLLIDGIKIKR